MNYNIYILNSCPGSYVITNPAIARNNNLASRGLSYPVNLVKSKTRIRHYMYQGSN